MTGVQTCALPICFDDTKGSEELFIQAQKDFNQLIKNNLSVTVQSDHTHSTGHDATINVGNNLTTNVNNDVMTTVGNNVTEKIAKNLTVEIGKASVLEATESITLKVGNTVLTLTADGFDVKASKYNVQKS